MNGSDTWLKLHTSLLLSNKLNTLPDNEHRWAYCACLMLAKKSIPIVATGFVAGMVRMGLRRWKLVRNNLVKAGLIDEAGNVIGFEESQLGASAIRMRRHRERHSDATVTRNVTQNVTGEVEVEVDKTPIVPKKELVTAAALCSIYNEVIRPPRNRSVTKELVSRVRSLHKKGYSPEDMAAVMRFRLSKDWWRDKPPTKVMSPKSFGDDLETSQTETLFDDGLESL